MDDNVKHILLTLIRLARNQHKQIDRMDTALFAIRQHLGNFADVKIDNAIRYREEQSVRNGQSVDETIRLLDHIEEQIRHF
jgi:hypothetical protein